MRRSIYLIVVVLLSVAVLSGLPSGTQAIDIGEGIQISAADSPNGGYVEDLGEDGGVRVELDGDADDVPGEGVNQDAITRIDRVLRITNTNDNETRGKAFVFIADSNENIVDFYRGSNVDDSIEGSDNQVGLGVGENILVGIEIDTLGEDTGDGSISISEFTVEADISEVANAILEVITGTPTTAGDVRFSANQSDGDELRFEYILETGESEDEQNFINEGPEFNRSYDVLGTYNATVSIDETAPRAPNESDTDTTQFVVRSPPEAGILGVDNSVEVEIPDDLETDDDSETVRRVAVSTTSDSTGNIEATAVAVESLDDLAGNPDLNGDPVAGINVTVPASAAGTTGLVTATIPETAVPTDSSPRNLTVERYDPDADKWVTLPTTLVDQTGGTVTLEAETSDFLLFAITDQPSAQVGPGPAPKFELESLTRVNQGDLVVGEAIVLEATVRNDGGAAVRDVVLSVERQVDGEFEPIPVARQEVQLTQEQSQTVQISHRPSESALANIDDGTGTGTVTFDAEVGQAQDSIDIPVEETLTASVEPGSVTDISDATPGRVIEFEPTITNEEDVAIDTQPVFLQLDGETVDNDTVNLGADQSTTVALSFLPSAQDVGSLNFTVRAPPGSTPVNATVLEPASYQIRDADLPDDAPVAGSEITATAIVNNTGDQNGSRPIKLTLGGSTVNNTILELNPDESTNVTLTFETSINTLATGGQSTTLQTYSDTEQKSIDLREPATFSIDSVTPSPSNPGPIAGNDLSVDITITNTGGVTATQNIVLSADGQDLTQQSVQVSGGSTETVTLTAPTGAGEIIDAGTQQLRVNTDNDAQEASTTIREPANIAVQIDDTNSPVIEGNRLQVDTIVENTGDGTATDREVALEVNEDEATSRQLTLDGGERAEITLEATVSTVGDQTITVTTGDETAQRTVTVIEAPDEPLFRMSNLSVPDDVFRTEGQSVTVTADVTNIGDVEGSQTVSITIGGTTRSTSDVTLDGNETQTVSTTVPATALLVGDRAVTVSSADDSVSGLIVVREPAPPRFTVDIANIPTPIAGSATSVDIAVENTGQGTATQTIELNLTLDDETIDTTAQGVTLGPGGSTTETLSLDVTGESRAGNFTTELTATSANQTTSTRTETDFGTITSGINAADTGGSVQVAAETYRETLSIDKEVTVGSDGAVVTAPEGSSSDATVEISAGGTLIDGLIIRGSSTAVQAVETSTITDVQIDNATGQTTTGIDINADDVTMSFSQIQSVREGINVTTADVSVLDTQITDTTFAINATGDASNLTAERLNVLRSENGFFTNTGKHAFTQSNIENNNVAIDADRPGGAVTTVDATENWWGRPSGPLSSEILSPVTVQPFRGNPKIPADYEITSPTGSTSVSDPVTVGETISVDVAVENTGGTSGATNNQRIELFVDGQKEDETAQFQLGENGTVDTASFAQLDTLEYQVEPADAGSSLSLTVRTENNVVSPSNVNAQTPPSIGVESINVGNSVRTDQTLSVDATINNSGQADGTTDVRLDFNGRPVATETGVSVPGQGTNSVTLTHSPQASLADSDDVSVTVIATDSGATRSDTVDVNAAPEPPEDDDDDAAGGGGGGGGGFGVSGLANPNQLGGVQRQAVSQTVSITDIGQKNDQVRSVGIDFNQQAVGTVSVTALDDPPADTNYPQQRATPLTAVDVTVPDAAENQPATVRIAVDRDLVQDTRAAPGDLQVERFDNGQYTVLQTSVADVTADEVVLEANTPGFSVFAVTVPKPGQQVTPTPTPTPAPTPIPTQTPTPAPDETSTTTETETETPTSTPGGIPGFGVMVAVLAILIAALVFHRRSS